MRVFVALFISLLAALVIVGLVRQSKSFTHQDLLQTRLHMRYLILRHRMEVGAWPGNAQDIFSRYNSQLMPVGMKKKVRVDASGTRITLLSSSGKTARYEVSVLYETDIFESTYTLDDLSRESTALYWQTYGK